MTETQQQDTLFLFFSYKFFQYDYQSIENIYNKKADSLKIRNFNLLDNNKNIIINSDTLILKESLFKDHSLKKKQNEINNLNKSLDPFFIIYVLVSLIFAWAFFNYKKNIRQILNAAFSNQKMQYLVREQNLFKSKISLFLYITFIISYSFFLIQAYSYFFISSEIGNIFHVSLKLSVAIAFFILFKWLIMYFIGNIFKNLETALLYILNSLIYNVITSLILIPLTFIIFYIKLDLKEYFLYIGLILLLILNLLRYFRYIIIGLTYSKFSYFYLILYLCSLEILPILIVLKLFFKLNINNIGFQ